MVRQPDGRLVLELWRETATASGERREIERLLPDGRPDPSFGKDGRVVVSGGGGLALRPDGGILVGAGSCNGAGGLILLDSHGVRDPNFGTGGCSASVGFGIGRIAVQEDGRILLTGAASYCPPCGHDILPRSEIALARLLPDGSRDPGFGNDGVVLTHSEDGLEEATPTGLAPTDEGGLLVTGGNMLLRFTAGGALDPGFGQSGKVEVGGLARAMLVQPDGRIVVASSSPVPCCAEVGDFVLGRFEQDGMPDTSFGIGGTSIADIGVDDIPLALGPTPGGGVLLAGESGGGENCSVLCSFAPILLRFGAAGSLDPTYGAGNGIATLPAPEGPESGRYQGLSVLVTGPDGEAVLAGGPGTGDAYAIARAPDGTPDLSFGEDGLVVERHRLPSNTEATGLAMRPNGQIAVAAEGDPGIHDWGGFLLGFRRNGRPSRHHGSRSGIVPTSARGQIQPGGAGRLIAWGDEAHFLLRVRRDGRVDRSYGTHGRAQLPHHFRARAFIASPDGNATVVGRVNGHPGMAVYRVNAHGRPFAGFGNRGLAIASFGAKESAEGRAALVESDGRVVVTGWAGTSAAAARLLPDGRVDPRFGHRGRIRHLLGYASVGTQVAALGGGVVIACTTEETTGRSMAGIVRLDRFGHRVRTFGRRGSVPPGAAMPPLALLTGSRRIVLVSDFPRQRLGGALLRAYRPDGSVDYRFGHRGKARAGVGQRKIFQPLTAVRQPDGKIVVGGTAGAWYVGNQTELIRFR